MALTSRCSLALALALLGLLGLIGLALRAPAPARALRARRLAAGNPFEGKSFYVNPSYRTSLLSSIETAEGSVKATLESMEEVPSAYWLDRKAKIRGNGTKSMQGILADAEAQGSPLVVFIVYDLPNRDCHAKASNGEICCKYQADGRCDYTNVEDATCTAGLNEYKESYIDEIAALLQAFGGRVPVVLVIEPDSLPNLSTNQGDPRCGNSATKNAYEQGVSYAVTALASADPQAAIYLDAGHGGWLGWQDNLQDFVQTVEGLQVSEKLRGFATNVAGYQHLGELCPSWDYCLEEANRGNSCCADPCGLLEQYNPSNNEVNYALHLREAMKQIPDFVPHMIVDSGRNGVAGMRSRCQNWCNVRGAGAGHVATTATAKADLLDAYFWLKTPGESDGCTEQLPSGGTCPRFDADCASADSLGSRPGEPRAPEAGQWFDYQVKQLAANAKLGL